MFSLTDIELVLGPTLGGRPAKIKFDIWFGHALGFEHSAELLSVGNGELVITNMLGHHNHSPVFDCNKVQTEVSVSGALVVVVLDYYGSPWWL